jgi:hypothetical protein
VFGLNFTHSWSNFLKLYLLSESQMTALCDGDEQCLYDTKAMGSLEIGESTRNAHQYYRFLHEAMKPSNTFFS